MKSLTFYIILGLFYLTVLSARMQSEDTDEFGETTPNPKIALLKAIVNDPEFLSLNPKQQIRIFVIVYENLEDLFRDLKQKSRFKSNKK